MVIVGSARQDERGKISGGKAGDSTGGEVGLQDYYLHSKGWYVLRARDSQVAKKIGDCMLYACANDCIGYNQAKRLSLYNAVKGNGFKCDLNNLKTKVETDCSALVRVCCAYAGIKLGDFTTANLKSVLLSSGKFIEVKLAKSDLRVGDILCTKTKGHTVIVVKGDDTVSIELDVLNKGDKGNQVKTLQRLLLAVGYYSGKVDGDFGVKTNVAVRGYQKAKGLSIDGVVGKNTWCKLLGVS